MKTETHDLFNNPVFEMFDELSAAVIATARWHVAQEKQKDGQRPEQQRRREALEWIDEVLEWRPLAAFSAVQLEFLGLLIGYWREAEIEAGAPEPDPLPPPPQQQQ
jgi:hypothetical protein